MKIGLLEGKNSDEDGEDVSQGRIEGSLRVLNASYTVTESLPKLYSNHESLPKLYSNRGHCLNYTVTESLSKLYSNESLPKLYSNRVTA